MHIEVYTDGSATTKDKPGGYGYVIIIDGKKHSEGSGHIEKGTNNDAELQAAIEGLTAAKDIQGVYFWDNPSAPASPMPKSITLVSDSQIVLGWANGSYAFRQENKIEKYKQLKLLVNLFNVQTRWIEGHTGDEHNERCDKLANAARLGKDVDAIKEKVKKQARSIIVKISVDSKIIDRITNESIFYANQLAPAGSELWTASVVDKFKELLDNNKWFKTEQE